MKQNRIDVTLNTQVAVTIYTSSITSKDMNIELVHPVKQIRTNLNLNLAVNRHLLQRRQ